MTEDFRLQDPMIVRGVRTRRLIAWVLDALILGVVMSVGTVICFVLGLATLGLAWWPLFALLGIVPFVYSILCIASPLSATPGQALMGLSVRRVADLGPPDLAQAIIAALGYYVTMATSGLLLLASLVIDHKRALHDVVSGLVVVRADALRSESLTPAAGAWNMGRRFT